MIKNLAKLLAAILIFVSMAYGEEKAPVSLADYTSYADASYANKSLSLDARKEVMEKMISASDGFKDSYDIQWRTAQAIYVYADTLHYKYQAENYEKALSRKKIEDTDDVITYSQDLSGDQEKKLLSLGITIRKYADNAVKIRPDGVEGHYYDAMGIATYAFGKSIVKALMEGLGSKYQDHLDKALLINKDYQEGNIYAAYGRYWYKLPWPKRSKSKSLTALLEAEKADPQNILALDFLGDTYFSLGKKADAERSWKKVLSSTEKAYQEEEVKKLAAAKLEYLMK